MKTIAILTAALCLPVFCSQTCWGDLTLLEYDTTNPNGANGDPAPNLDPLGSPFVTGLQLSRGAGVVPNQGIVFNSRDWSLATSVDLNSDKYIQWGWSAAGQALDLTDLTLQYDISVNGPAQLTIALSINNEAFVPIFTDTSVNPSDETATISLTDFDQVNSAVFRLFGFDAVSSGGTLDIEEIVPGGARGIIVTGEFSAVPEPGSLCATAAFGLAIVLRRKR